MRLAVGGGAQEGLQASIAHEHDGGIERDEAGMRRSGDELFDATVHAEPALVRTIGRPGATLVTSRIRSDATGPGCSGCQAGGQFSSTVGRGTSQRSATRSATRSLTARNAEASGPASLSSPDDLAHRARHPRQARGFGVVVGDVVAKRPPVRRAAERTTGRQMSDCAWKTSVSGASATTASVQGPARRALASTRATGGRGGGRDRARRRIGQEDGRLRVQAERAADEARTTPAGGGGPC